MSMAILLPMKAGFGAAAGKWTGQVVDRADLDVLAPRRRSPSDGGKTSAGNDNR